MNCYSLLLRLCTESARVLAFSVHNRSIFLARNGGFHDKEGQERVPIGLVASKIEDFERTAAEIDGDEPEKAFEEPHFLWIK